MNARRLAARRSRGSTRAPPAGCRPFAAFGGGEEAGERLLADAVEDVGLVGKVEIDRHRRVADAARDLGQGHVAIALLDEQLAGGVEDLAPRGLFALGVPSTSLLQRHLPTA